MRRLIQFLMCSLLLVSAVASADDLSRKQRKLLEETQIAYGATIRWGSMDDAIGYLDPKLRKESRRPSSSSTATHSCACRPIASAAAPRWMAAWSSAVSKSG